MGVPFYRKRTPEIMKNIGFGPADILLPKKTDFSKWSVVACDQYTSEPEYWEETAEIVGDAPSALRLILPEVYLEQDDVSQRITSIHQTMRQYLEDGIFEEYPAAYFYIERTLADGTTRKGIIGAVDLEQYDYSAGSRSLIRATEGTVLERIPPRMKVREDAPLELPHIMMLIDDPQKTVMEPLAAGKAHFKKVYDFTLMQNGGHLTGYLPDKQHSEQIEEALAALYHISAAENDAPLLFAVGDGNHSLATAKACYEKLKSTMPDQDWSHSPARFALAEVVNLHDDSLQFEPIHRVITEINPDHFLRKMTEFFEISPDDDGVQSFKYVTGDKMETLSIINPTSNLCVGTLQGYIDIYLSKYGGKVDYIHGDDVVMSLASKPNSIGLILPKMDKSDLFRTIQLDGALPRKTFSMGHANDKRFYLESRKIK